MSTLPGELTLEGCQLPDSNPLLRPSRLSKPPPLASSVHPLNNNVIKLMCNFIIGVRDFSTFLLLTGGYSRVLVTWRWGPLYPVVELAGVFQCYSHKSTCLQLSRD